MLVISIVLALVALISPRAPSSNPLLVTLAIAISTLPSLPVIEVFVKVAFAEAFNFILELNAFFGGMVSIRHVKLTFFARICIC